MRICDRVLQCAVEVLSRQPEPISSVQLGRELRMRLPDLDPKSIAQTMWNLPHRHPQIERPAPGMYGWRGDMAPADAQAVDAISGRRTAAAPATISEISFYAPLAEFLRVQEGLDMCVEVGGSRFGDMWGTPDVAGTIQPASGHTRLLAAELKVRVPELLKGFGQACAYRWFAHLSYLALPRCSRFSDLARLEDLCAMYRLGLIVFDPGDPANPRWEMCLRAQPCRPNLRCLGEKLALLQRLTEHTAPQPPGGELVTLAA